VSDRSSLNTAPNNEIASSIRKRKTQSPKHRYIYTTSATMTDSQVNEPTETQDQVVEQQEEEPKQNNTRTKALIAFVLLALIGFVVYDSLTNKHIGATITTFLEWIEDNPALGFFAFMLVYFVATVPGSILTLGAGFVFAHVFGLGTGVLLGAMSVFFGASSGAIAAFFVGSVPIAGLGSAGIDSKIQLVLCSGCGI
jgi:cation transport ATPase